MEKGRGDNFSQHTSYLYRLTYTSGHTSQNSTRTFVKKILFAEFAKMRVAQKLGKQKIEEKMHILASKEVEVLLEDT